MKDENTFEKGSAISHRPRGTLLSRLVLNVILLAVGFAAGMYWERSEHVFAPFQSLTGGSQASEPAPSEVHISAGHFDPGTLEERLTEQIRSMHSELSRLDEEAKEGRIHYNLLLQRGYKKDDGVCLALVSRQTEIKEEIAHLQDSAREAEALRQRLRSAVRNLAEPDNTVVGVEESLRRDVLQFINRTSLSDTSPAVIPDSAWIDKREISSMSDINTN